LQTFTNNRRNDYRTVPLRCPPVFGHFQNGTQIAFLALVEKYGSLFQETPMSENQSGIPLEQRLAAIAGQNIKADPIRLVESIRRQFSNPNEYARELVANGLDAGATRIQVKGDVWENNGETFGRLQFIDDGKGMSFSEVQSYLTVFESHKDGAMAVGKHGVGKVSPWADRDLAGYIIDTCDGKERTELFMTSVQDGVLRRYQGYPQRRGTTVALLWRGRDHVAIVKEKLAAAKKILVGFCRYLATPVTVDDWDPGAGSFTARQITVRPEQDGWIPCGEINIRGFPAAFWYRLGGTGGLHLYQGGVFITRKMELRGMRWDLDDLAVAADSHAFHLPISRNDVIEDGAYQTLCSHLLSIILPDIMTGVCAGLDTGVEEPGALDFERASGLIIEYLRIKPDFGPAMSLPLFPVLPFGYASVLQVRAEAQKFGCLHVCVCSGDEFAGFAGHDVVLDEKRMTESMEKLLKERFGPLTKINYQEDSMEAPAGSKGAELSALERKFQESLVLLSCDMDLIADSGNDRDGDANSGDAGGGGARTRRSVFGALLSPDIPDVRFRLSRLVRLDGTTPVQGVKFKINGSKVTLNLNHPEIKAHLAFAERDADLAAHWCIRELILSDRLDCFKHLSYDGCEAVVLRDAAGRCAEPEGISLNRPPRNKNTNPGLWNDDGVDWKKFFGKP
jgi:hypothetical protein